MRGHHDARPRGRAGVVAEHVAGFVDTDVLQPELLEHPLQLPAADLFLERRRGDLAEADLILDRLRLARLCVVDRRPHGGVIDEIGRALRALREHAARHRRRRRHRQPEHRTRHRSQHGNLQVECRRKQKW